ncbi:MAG: ATP phosphoribosyltransferase [Labilithrix sp.]|nr:ATP phosphoribosyltransferase [Labilithrix sp.]
MSPRPQLKIALPKGRTLGHVSKIFERAGVACGALTDESRALVRRARFGEHDLELFLLKPDDVPTYVEYGTADLGVCGRDVLVEREVDVYQPVDLGIGRCRLVVAGPARASSPAGGGWTGRMPRVATKYRRTAAAHFARQGTQVEIVDVQGSVELAPLTGLADVIVDLVETGTTLAENGLAVKEEIASVSTMLIANRASYKLRADVIGPLVDALRGAVG